jgi:hypothetical protein
MKGMEVKESAAKRLNKAWNHGKKVAAKSLKAFKQTKNKAFTFTATKLFAISGIVTHPGTQVFLRNLATRFNRGVTIEEIGNTIQQPAIENSTRMSRKRNTNHVRNIVRCCEFVNCVPFFNI